MERSDLEEMNSNQWTISLSSLCEAASRSDEVVVRSYLIEDEVPLLYPQQQLFTEEPTTKPTHANNNSSSNQINSKEHCTDTHTQTSPSPLGLIPTSDQAFVLIELLSFLLLDDNDDDTLSNVNSAGGIVQNNHLREREKQRRNFLEHFSVNNEHSSILSLSSKSFEQINYKSSGKFKKQQQQLLMSLRSLLLLPPFHFTPWGIIEAAVRAIQQQSLVERPRNDAYFRNDSFAFCVLVDIRNFMRKVCDGFSSLSKSEHNNSDNDHDHDDHKDNDNGSGPLHIRVAAIEDCLIKIFTQIIKPFFHPVESRSSPAFDDDDDNDNNTSNYNGKVQIYNCYHLEKSFEIIIPLLEAGRSIDICHDRNTNTDWTAVAQCMDNLYLNPGQCSKKRLRSDMIITLLVLSRNISKYMNPVNWCHLRGLIYDGLINDDIITPSGYGEIFELIVAIAVSGSVGEHIDDAYCKSYPTWSELLVEIYCISRTKKRILNSVESQLKSSVINLPIHAYRSLLKDIINIWRHYHDEEKRSDEFEESHLMEVRLPQWACLNILFIILHAQTENDSQLVEDLLSDSLPIDIDLVSHKEETLSALLSIINLDDDGLKDREELRSFFHDVSCDTKGKVNIKLASNISKKFGMLIQLIDSCFSFYRICPQETNNMDLEDVLTEHIHIFKEIGNSLLQSEEHDVGNSNVFLLGAAIYIGLFATVPSSRMVLIRHFVGVICNDYKWSSNWDRQVGLYPKQVCCWIISSFANILVQIDSAVWEKEGTKVANEDICFQPLYDLFSGKTQRRLPLEIANELISSFAHLPSGRKVILNFAQVNLQPRSLDDIEGQHSASGDNIHRYSKTGVALKALLSLIHENNKGNVRCHTDEISLQALGQVSNFIALNRPGISLSNRSSFFFELGSLVESCQINSWVSERLLSATLWALLHHFSFASTSNRFSGLVFTPDCEEESPNGIIYEDFNLLTRLAILLIQNRAQFQEFDSLPSTVLTLEEAVFIMESLSFRKEMPQDEPLIDNRLSTRSIALSCFGAVIRYILQVSCSHTHSLNESSLKLSTASTHEIRAHLCETEAKSWTTKIIETTKDFKNMVPIWTQTLSPHLISMIPSQKPSEIQSMKLFPVYDNLTKLLIDALNTFLTSNNQQQLNEIEKKERIVHLFACVRILQNTKRKALASGRIQNMLQITPPLHPKMLLGTECMVGTRFFVSTALSIEILIKASTGDYKELIHLKELMSATLEFCEVLRMVFEYYIQSGCDEGIHVACMEFLRAIWSYYNLSCSEIVLCDVIDFIEARSKKELAKVPDNLVSISPHNAFDSLEKIYDFVRKYRFSFVSCFRMIFNFNRMNNVWKNNMDSFFLFCIDIACTLSQDLHSGLNALSGGITQSFYRCIIQIIEDVLEAAIQIPMESIIQSNNDFDSDLLLDLRNNCVAASSALWNSISDFDFKNHQLFKSTIRASLMLLPQLHQKIDRIALLNLASAVSSKYFLTRNRPSVDFRAPILLGLCIHQINEDVLIDGARKRRKYPENSLELIGKKSAGRGIGDNFLTIPRLLEWSTEQSLIVIERQWTSEGHDDIFCNGTIVSTTNAFDSFPTIQTYAAKRLCTLKESLSAIIPLFLTANVTENANGLNGLSFSAKRRLCSCMERIFLTLKVSLRFIIQYIDGYENCSKDELTLNMQVALAESIACVLSWLMTSNFTVTVQKYCTQLSNIKTTKEEKSQRINNDLIHVRLTKVINKIDGVEKLLKNIDDTLKKDKDAESSFDSLVRHVLENCSDIFENNENATMGQMIEEYFYVSSECIKKSKFPPSKLRTNSQKSALKGRLRKDRQGRRKSRNDVVDEWMELDFELNEKGTFDDNYEDLEDWILPG